VPLAGAGVVVALEFVGVLAALAGVDSAGGVEAEELVLFEELPQPAIASRPASRVSVQSLDVERGSA
jgi:hypothetical protein